MQDIIYSTTYFDYLSEDLLEKLFKNLYTMLKPNGKLIIALMNTDMHHYEAYQWLLDWDGLKSKSEQQLSNLFNCAGFSEDAMSTMKLNTSFCYLITKNMSQV
ncbi:MAG: class I SAM-dependent methyltransferase [Nitrospirota bacterium]